MKNSILPIFLILIFLGIMAFVLLNFTQKPATETNDNLPLTHSSSSDEVEPPAPSNEDQNSAELKNLIIVENPKPEDQVGNPMIVSGMARGYWFFEATAPVVVTNWNGLIIGEGYMTAEDEWMTEEFVPFSGTINYTLPEDSYSKKGIVIFQRSNPSGLPENDRAYEMSVLLE
jgi:hypothetical protein